MPQRKPSRTSDLPELTSTKGACEILGVDKMTLKRWRESGYFSIQPQVVGVHPIWTVDDIQKFSDEKGRQRARATVTDEI